MTVPLPPLWVFDVECYSNYFLLMVRNALAPAGTPGAAAHVVYERFNDQVLANAAMPAGTLVSFNGNNYDVPLISLACNGANNITLKRASDAVIVRGVKPWDLEEQFGFERMTLDHIDLIEVAPGQASLKIYGGRLHSQRMQDLPIEPDAIITDAQRLELQRYCGNDLLTTIDLYRKLEPQIALRVEMSREFGIDLRSKSDAQIAEAVIRSEVEKRIGRRVYRPELAHGYTFKYRMPPYVAFAAPGLQQVVDIIRDTVFALEADGSVELPPVLKSMRIRIGRGVYRMGIGGLHSSEECIAHFSDAHHVVLDRDVTSYYPSIVLTQRLYPAHLGLDFLAVYEDLVARRVAAKRDGNKVMNEALKVTINGSFGKFGSRWSTLYSPELMIAVTLTGQLALLMLIESLEANGIEVLSANTDGIVSKVPRALRDVFEAVIAAWELTTGFGTEETEYSKLLIRDVNNYLGLTADGEFKQKGVMAFVSSKKTELEKNPQNYVCVDAVKNYVKHGTPIEHTIAACTDVRRFLTIRQVKGGAVYVTSEREVDDWLPYEGGTWIRKEWADQGLPYDRMAVGGPRPAPVKVPVETEFLGKAVRWYYAQGETRHIAYKTNGNKVARSEGARPLMELPTTLPHDIDRNWYVQEARSILGDIGL